MKKILSAVMMFVFSVAIYAQKDVTKFLGIPVDGFKPAMIQKLKDKGFVSSTYDKDILEGEFNGTQVNVHIVTNNNKVYRILLCDAIPMDETGIKIRFNRLCQQFKGNPKYISIDDYEISDDEDISYEMSVHKKRYEAVFFQQLEELDSAMIMNQVTDMMLKKYTAEELRNPTEEMQDEIKDFLADFVQKKSVWFMISESYGKYYISMFYDNGYNQANGEDL